MSSKMERSKRSIGLWDFEGQYAFFEAYHSNPINVIIHWVFVWPIFFGLILLFYYVPLFSITTTTLYVPNLLGFLFAMLHAFYYVTLDIKAGSFAAILCFLCWMAASSLARSLGFYSTFKVFLAIQGLSFGAQAVGHGVFEKRAPAKDNILQAAVTAPFFVLLEVLERVIGYEPYQGFHAKVKPMIEAEIKGWWEKQAKTHTN